MRSRSRSLQHQSPSQSAAPARSASTPPLHRGEAPAPSADHLTSAARRRIMTNATHETTETGDAPAVGVAPPGFRLPADTRLGAVRLQVADLDRSLDYYRQVLGLRLVSRDGNAATLAALGDDAPLVRLHERRGAAPVPHRGLIGLYHFAILLPDRAALGRFVAHLAEIGERAGASDHLVSEALYLRDPDGL